MSYDLQRVEGMMPNQSYGTLNDKRFYFRARWGHWTLRTGDSEDGAVLGDLVDEGSQENAGWWEQKEHKEFVIKLLQKHSFIHDRP